jgi:hypothetical protein
MMNKNQKLILIAVAVVVVAMFIYPPFQAVRSGTIHNMGYGWIFALSKRGYMTINVSMLIIQWIGVFIVGGIAFFLAKGESAPAELLTQKNKVDPHFKSDQHDLSDKHMSLPLKKVDLWPNWKSFTIALVITVFLVMIISGLAGTKPPKNMFWTWLWVYLTLEAWKYWKWKALLPFPLYFFALTIGYLFLDSAGVEYHSIPNLILLTVSNFGGLAIFYMLLHRARSSTRSVTSENEGTETKKIIREAELRSAQKFQIITTTQSEVKRQNEEFIALLKSTINENGLNTIPGDDLIEIYKQAKSIEASNNIPDIELSKAIDTVLEEIKKRGLSQESKLQANKQQEIHHYKDYSFEQDKAGGSSRWLYVIAISIIIIAIALVINKSFYSEAPKEPTFRLQDYYNKYKDFYGDIPLEDVAKDAYTRLEFNKDYATYDHFKKETGIEPLIQEDNDRRARSFLDKLKEVKIPFPFRFSEESIYGKLFRYDRFTSTVEIRYGYNKDTFKWMPRPQFKDLQHVRDALTQQEKNNHIRAIEEQTEALKNAQSHQQLSGSNMEQGGIMRKYEADKLKRDVEDIKNILEDEKRERDFQNMQRR